MHIVVPELAPIPSCEPQLNAERQPVGFSGLSGFSAPPLNGNYRRLMVANPRCPSFGTHSSYGLRESTGSQAASPAAMHTVLVVAALGGLPRKRSSITCVRRTPAVQIAIDCNQGAAIPPEGRSTGLLVMSPLPRKSRKLRILQLHRQRTSRRYGTGPPSVR